MISRFSFKDETVLKHLVSTQNRINLTKTDGVGSVVILKS